MSSGWVFTSDNVWERLTDLFFKQSVKEHIRSDDGSALTFLEGVQKVLAVYRCFLLYIHQNVTRETTGER